MKKSLFAIILSLIVCIIASAADKVPADIMQRIQAVAAEAFEENPEMQRSMIQAEVKGYLELKNLKADDIPADIVKKIKEEFTEEFPGRYSLQKNLAEQNIKAYREIKKFSDKDVPPELVQKIIAVHP